MVSPELRQRFSVERKQLIGIKINEGQYKNCIVKDHVNGSLYELINESGVSFFAKHNKNKNQWEEWKDDYKSGRK